MSSARNTHSSASCAHMSPGICGSATLVDGVMVTGESAKSSRNGSISAAGTLQVHAQGEAVHLTPSQTAALSKACCADQSLGVRTSLEIEERDALLLEPWTTTEFGTVQEMVKVARATSRRVNPKTEKPFEVLKLHPKFELEVVVVWFTWMLAATTPLLFVALPFLALILPPVTLTTTFAATAILLLLCVYPHRVIELPCAKRVTNPLHNRKIGAAFLKYFPLRVIIEDEAVLDSPK